MGESPREEAFSDTLLADPPVNRPGVLQLERGGVSEGSENTPGGIFGGLTWWPPLPTGMDSRLHTGIIWANHSFLGSDARALLPLKEQNRALEMQVEMDNSMRVRVTVKIPRK